MNSKEFMIETNGLVKSFGKLKAVDNVSISVNKGEIYGFLGLNGAGKTTTIRMLLGMIRPISGEIKLCGRKIVPGQNGPWEKVGYLVETPCSYPDLTVRENLLAVSRLRSLRIPSCINHIMKLLRLEDYEKTKTRNLSLGNNQRLGLAKALIHKPELLLLDEPSNGLDPAGIVEIREMLKDFAFNRNITVFISSHNLDEISRIATRIGIIHKGRLIQEIDTTDLERSLKKILVAGVRNTGNAAGFLIRKGFDVTGSGEQIFINSTKAIEKPEDINRLLVEAGYPPYSLGIDREDLESYFLRIIGE